MNVFVVRYFKISYYKFGYGATALRTIIQVIHAHLCLCFGTTADKGRDSDVKVFRLNITVKRYCETEDNIVYSE